MARLPAPDLNFTIPSQQDGVALECRIYHPNSVLPISTVSQNTSCRRKGSIVAHPFTSFGGNMNDPVVSLIAETCLAEGFIVGMFNFRGAGGSDGHTSLQTNPEQYDYRSIIGFMVYYLHYLDLPSLQWNDSLPSQGKVGGYDKPNSPLHASAELLPSFENKHRYSSFVKKDKVELNPKIQLLLAGYSYGSLITMILPASLQTIIAPFETNPVDSNCAEIRRKAEDFAILQSNQLSKHLTLPSHYCKRDHPLSDTSKENPPIYGGRESLGTQIESDKSLEISDNPPHHPVHSSLNDNANFAQKENPERLGNTDFPYSSSLERLKSSKSLESRTNHLSRSLKIDDSSLNNLVSPKEARQAMSVAIDDIDVAYLLVSPLQGLVYNLLTLWPYKIWNRNESIEEIENKLKTHFTLAIFGDNDIFVSVNKLRDWAKRLAIDDGSVNSKFSYTEVKGADHFWRNRQNTRVLEAEIKKFLKNLSINLED